MTFSPLTLECFELADATDPPPSADYLRGVDDGRAQALASAEADRATALVSIAASLSDMTFGFTEAKSYLIEGIRPLMTQISELMLPELVQTTFARHLIDLLEREFGRAIEGAVAIAVAPSVANEVRDTLPADLPFEVRADGALQPGQALLRGGETHVMLDLPALIESLQKALRGLDTLERSQTHG